MIVDKKDLEELYEFVENLLCNAGISDRYYYELDQKFEAIKAKIEAES